MVWVNAVIQGILLGGLYALYAAGLSLVFGVMRIVNLAHGDIGVFAAYLAVLLAEHLSLSPWLSLLLVVPAMAVGGYLLQRLLLNATLDSGLAPLLATFGLAVVIENALQQGFSANSQRLQVGNLATSSIHLGSQIAIGWFPLITLLAAIGVLGGLQLMLRAHAARPRAARDLRRPRNAQLVGIDSKRIYGVAMAISLATAALAGIFLGIRTIFAPTCGSVGLIFAFEAVIIGGLGSIWGTLARRDRARRRTDGRRADQPGMGRARRPHRLPGRAARPSDRSFSRRHRHERISLAPARLARVLSARARLGACRRTAVARRLGRAEPRPAVHAARDPADVEPAGRLRRPGLDRPAGVYRHRRLRLLHPRRPRAIDAVRRRSRWPALVAAVISLPTAAVAFRLRGGYFAIGTWVIAEIFHLLTVNWSYVGGGSGTTILSRRRH